MTMAARSAAAPRRSPQAPYSAQPYVFIPDPLIESYVRDPLAVGVYVAIARLTLIRKGAVALSAGDLAAWVGSTEHADQVAIMRRICKLADAGWLCVTRATGQKHHLLPTWGPDRTGTLRPWDFARPSSGRPEHVRGRRVPLALLDISLGQLKPQEGRAPALISRYLTHPLLDLADLGTYTIRLRTEVALTARLTHLGLTSAVLPNPRALLMEAAGGTLTTFRGSAAIGVGLTAWGYDQLGIAPPLQDVREWGSGSMSGSVCGSPEMRDQAGVLPHGNAEEPASMSANAGNTWDVGIMKQINMLSSPNMHFHAGGGRSDQVQDSRGTEDPHNQQANFPDQLAPQIVANHQALNADRIIFPGEWWELLEMQQTHGERQLSIWQARAARAERAGVRQISPAYYAACAAQAAFETYRPPRYERAPAPAMEPPSDAPMMRPPMPSVPPPALDPACDALLQEMGIREREKLAGVPLDDIQQWAAVLDHAGLAARFDDVRGFAHTQLRRGNRPPSMEELEHWAARARARAAAAPAAPLTPADEERIAAREAEIQVRAAVLAPPDLTEEERLTLLADLEAGLDDDEVRARLLTRRDVMSISDTPTDMQQHLADLRLALPRRHWSLLDRVTLEGDVGELRLVCSVADRGLVEAHLLPALRAQGGLGAARVVTRGTAGQVTPPATEVTPPDWIAPDQWSALPPLMRTVLVGSTLDADGTLHCASPALRALLDARYARELATLRAGDTAGDRGDTASHECSPPSRTVHLR